MIAAATRRRTSAPRALRSLHSLVSVDRRRDAAADVLDALQLAELPVVSVDRRRDAAADDWRRTVL